MKILIQKLSSRKFLMGLASVISGLLLMFGVAETSAQTIAGAVLTIIGTVVYIYTEHKIDIARINSAATAVDTIVNEVKK